jgi:hypothetical protein
MEELFLKKVVDLFLETSRYVHTFVVKFRGKRNNTRKPHMAFLSADRYREIWDESGQSLWLGTMLICRSPKMSNNKMSKSQMSKYKMSKSKMTNNKMSQSSKMIQSLIDVLKM